MSLIYIFIPSYFEDKVSFLLLCKKGKSDRFLNIYPRYSFTKVLIL